MQLLRLDTTPADVATSGRTIEPDTFVIAEDTAPAELDQGLSFNTRSDIYGKFSTNSDQLSFTRM